jgi:DNA-binding LacI/PurR family transcriptional regulator
MLPENGIRVPEDLAVVSFNSTEMSARARPPMTSVWQPLKEIGAAAVGMLVARIEGRELKERIRRFPMRLDIRESCGAPSPVFS